MIGISYSLDKAGVIYEDGDLVGGEETYASLSPFATWTLIAAPADNPGLDLSKVERVVLTFEGKGYARLTD